MGRVKLEIKRIENTNNRLVTFAKRKAGLIKKAQELATLCDIDVALIMFSPGNKLTQYATNSRVEEIISRYANVPEGERIKRKMENLQQLNRAIRKMKGEPDTGNYSRFNMPIYDMKGDCTMELAQEELTRLRHENENAQRRLRLFEGDDGDLDPLSYEELMQMELQVQTTIDKIRLRKHQLQILDYNMKEHELSALGTSWLQKDAEIIKEDAENEAFCSRSSGYYVGDQGTFMFSPNIEFNQGMLMSGMRVGGQATFGQFGQFESLENGGQSVVVDSADNYQSFNLDMEFDCQDSVPESQVDSSQ